MNIQSSNFALLCLVLGFLSVMVGNVQAAKPPSTPDELSVQLDKIVESIGNNSSTPIKALDALLSRAENNNWPEIALEIIAYKIQVLIEIDKMDDAETLLKQYFNSNKLPNKPAISLRFLLSKLYIIDAQGKSSISTRELILSLVQLIEGREEQAEILLNVATSEYKNEEFKLAVINLKKAKDLSKNVDNPLLSSGILNSLGNIYNAIGEPEKALSHLQKAHQIALRSNDRLNESIVLFNISESLILLKSYDLARDRLNQVMVINLETNNLIGQAWVQNKLGFLNFKLEQYEDSRSANQKAGELFKRSGENRMHFQSRLGEIIALLKMQRLSEAIEIHKYLRPEEFNVENGSLKIEYTRLLSEIEGLSGNYKAAYESHIDYVDLLEKMHVKVREENLQKLILQYDLKKKESDNKILTKENELQLLKLEQQNQAQTIWFLIACIALIIITGIGIALHKQIKDRNHFKRMAMLDELTGAPNRRAILEFAENCFNGNHESAGELTVAIIDLDHFKVVNDKFGHTVGDQVLKSFSNCCQAILRNHDRYGRYGGEEWLLVLPNAVAKDVESVFDRLTKMTKNVELDNLPTDFEIRFSMGAAQKRNEDTSIQAVIKRADSKLYHAKATGRNRFVV